MAYVNIRQIELLALLDAGEQLVNRLNLITKDADFDIGYDAYTLCQGSIDEWESIKNQIEQKI